MRGTCCLLACLFAVLSATATTLSPMTVERLAQASEVIIEGRCGSSWSAWDAQHTAIFTYLRFQVTQVLKGTVSNTVIVKQIGGRADGYTVRVAGIRYSQPGEEHVLFLHPSMAGDGTFVIAGLVQGDFQVHRGPSETTVSNGVPAFYQRSGGFHEAPNARSMSLGQLEQRVRKTVGE